MADEEGSDNATVQMSADQIRRLHEQLAAQGIKAAQAKAQVAETEAEFTAEEAASEPEPGADPAAEYAAEADPEPAYAEQAEAEYAAHDEGVFEEPPTRLDDDAYAAGEVPAAEFSDADEAPPEPEPEPEPAPAPAPRPAAKAPVVKSPKLEKVAAPSAKKAAAAPAPVADEAPADEVEAPAPAPKVKVDKAKPAPKPAPAPKVREAPEAAPDDAQGGGAMLILGGIGALIAGISIALQVLPAFQGMGDQTWAFLGGAIGQTVGHLLLALGMFGAVSRTNGVAALVGTLHFVTMAGFVFYLLALLRVLELDDEIVRYLLLVPAILPGTTWLLSGIWGFASGAGAMGLLHGIFALLGGGALIGLSVGGLAGAFGGDDDIAIALALGGPGAVLLGAVFLAIALFGPVRRKPAG